FVMIRPLPISTLFPYTTLFRSPIISPTKTMNSSTFSTRRHGLILFVNILKRYWRMRKNTGLMSYEYVWKELPIQKRWVMISGHRSEEHTSELQSRENLVCRLLL